MGDQNKKEPIVKIFNKGKRVIDEIMPDTVVEVSQSRAEKLQKLFDAEIIIVAAGQDPHAAASNDSAKCAALKKEIVALEEKLIDVQKSDNAEIVEKLQKEVATLKKQGGGDESEALKADIEPLKSALAEKESECDKLVKDLDKAKKEIAKFKGKNK